MVKKNKLVCGWGINDVDYNVAKTQLINGRWRQTYLCPYYVKWKSMLVRCFSLKYQDRQPTYKDCTVCEDWKCLSNFIKWVDSQPNEDWINCEIDKDFLFDGNKQYHPETAVFISKNLNNFIKHRGNDRGHLMIGVSCDYKSTKNLTGVSVVTHSPESKSF